MRAPLGLNLTALESRFQAICWSRTGSAARVPAASSMVGSMTMRLASAAGRIRSIAARTALAGSTARRSSRSLPATMRLTSRMSSMRWTCALALRSMISSGRPSAMGSGRRVRRMSAQPRMAVSGVRSSWLMVERNSSLARLVASAAARARAAAS